MTIREKVEYALEGLGCLVGGLGILAAVPLSISLEIVSALISRKKSDEKALVSRQRRIRDDLKTWVKNAEPILATIIEQNPQKMEGFTYPTYYSGGGYGVGQMYEKIVLKDGQLYVTPFSAYGEYDRADRISSEDIASRILKQIIPEIIDKGKVAVTKWDSSGRTGYSILCKETSVLNRGRNQIVNEVRKRTGRNLKRDLEAEVEKTSTLT